MNQDISISPKEASLRRQLQDADIEMRNYRRALRSLRDELLNWRFIAGVMTVGFVIETLIILFT